MGTLVKSVSLEQQLSDWFPVWIHNQDHISKFVNINNCNFDQLLPDKCLFLLLLLFYGLLFRLDFGEIYGLEIVLAYVEKIWRVEGAYESSLRWREVKLPDPALHRLMESNSNQTEMVIR